MTKRESGEGAAAPFKFTKRSLTALPLPREGRRTYRDTEDRYLRLIVTAGGAKSFYVARKINGRSEKIWLGRFPDLTVENARKKAQRTVGEIAIGRNPQDRARAGRSPVTVRQLFTEYMERHAVPHKRSAAHDEALFRLHCGPLANLRVSAVHLRDVQRLHVKVGREVGERTANRVLCLLHVMFNKALEWGYTENANPAHGVRKFRERSRDRYLEPQELPAFFASLGEERDTLFRDFFLLALYTGARRGNLLAMKWEHVSLERGLWVIPAEEAKTDQPYYIPLIRPALDALANRRALCGDSPYVFPGRLGGHLAEVKGAWARVCRRAGISGLRIHDLRRTFATYQVNVGSSLHIVGQALGHRNYSTTQRYAPIQEQTIRASIERGTEAMWRAAGLATGGGDSEADRASVLAIPEKAGDAQ